MDYKLEWHLFPVTDTNMTARNLPKFDDLPNFHQYTGCAWDVWGKDDELGTVNLLTDEVIAEASKEIKYVPPRELSPVSD